MCWFLQNLSYVDAGEALNIGMMAKLPVRPLRQRRGLAPSYIYLINQYPTITDAYCSL